MTLPVDFLLCRVYCSIITSTSMQHFVQYLLQNGPNKILLWYATLYAVLHVQICTDMYSAPRIYQYNEDDILKVLKYIYRLPFTPINLLLYFNTLFCPGRSSFKKGRGVNGEEYIYSQLSYFQMSSFTVLIYMYIPRTVHTVYLIPTYRKRTPCNSQQNEYYSVTTSVADPGDPKKTGSDRIRILLRYVFDV